MTSADSIQIDEIIVITNTEVIHQCHILITAQTSMKIACFAQRAFSTILPIII